MKTTDINIRDPYILKDGEMYYLYGTRSETCWEAADGFDCYKSADGKLWEGPVEIFKRPQDFWADRKFWAPECYRYHDRYFLVTTFGAGDRPSGIQILMAAHPEGPFVPWSDGVITPEEWNCIDGTLYWENEVPYLIFSHAFEDDPRGSIEFMELSPDLKKSVGEPKTMFVAADAPWTCAFPYAKEEFGIDGDIYFSDGPSLYPLTCGALLMLWSSWGANGYSVGIARSDSGRLCGPWNHEKKPLFDKNGGHGMWFKSKGKIYYTLHYPNSRYKEHPVFFELQETEDSLTLGALKDV